LLIHLHPTIASPLTFTDPAFQSSDAHEVVVHEVDRDGMGVVLDLFRESVGERLIAMRTVKFWRST
jgi:hypothetical protein